MHCRGYAYIYIYVHIYVYILHIHTYIKYLLYNILYINNIHIYKFVTCGLVFPYFLTLPTLYNT